MLYPIHLNQCLFIIIINAQNFFFFYWLTIKKGIAWLSVHLRIKQNILLSTWLIPAQHASVLINDTFSRISYLLMLIPVSLLMYGLSMCETVIVVWQGLNLPVACLPKADNMEWHPLKTLTVHNWWIKCIYVCNGHFSSGMFSIHIAFFSRLRWGVTIWRFNPHGQYTSIILRKGDVCWIY